MKIISNGWLKLSEAEDTGQFTVTCNKCTSKNVIIECTLSMGSEWTGQYGSINMVCLNCGETQEIYE